MKLNDYHHLFELDYEQSEKFILDLHTKSSFIPFNNISVSVDHELNDGNIISIVNLNFKENFLTIVIDHQKTEDIVYKYRGSHRLKTSLPLVKSIEVDYNINRDTSKHIEAEFICSYNQYISIQAKANGIASIQTTDINFDVTHNLPGVSDINGKVKHSFKFDILDSDIVLEIGQDKITSKLHLEHLPDFKVDIAFDFDSMHPINAWLNYSSRDMGKMLKSELKYENVQILALNFKSLISDFSNLDFILEAKIPSKKMSFKVKNKLLEKLFYFDVVKGKETLTKIKLEQRQSKREEIERQFVTIDVQTPIDMLNDIQLSFKQKTGKTKYEAKASASYQGLFWKIEMIDEESDILRFYLNTESNILSDKMINIIFEKKLEGILQEMHLKTTFGNETFNIENNISQVSESRTEADLNISGSWGNTSVRSYVDLLDTEKHFHVSFIDRKGLKFVSKLEFNLLPNKYTLKSVIQTPFTDDLTIAMSLNRSESSTDLQFNMSQPQYEYAILLLGISQTTRNIQFHMKLDFENMIDFHTLQMTGEFSVGDSMIGVIGETILYEIDAKIDVIYNAANFAGFAVKVDKTDYGFAGRVVTTTPYSDFRQLKLNANIDMFGEDKYCNIVFKKNDQEFSCFLKQSKNESKYIVITNISTEIKGFTSISFEGAYDEKAHILFLKFKKEEDTFGLTAALNTSENIYDLDLEIENNMFSWKSFSLSGNFNLFSNSKSVVISGGSKDNIQRVHVKLNKELSEGNADIMIDVPFLGIPSKTFKLSYSALKDSTEAQIELNGDNFNVKIEERDSNEMAFDIQTPYIGYTNITGRYNFNMLKHMIIGKIEFTIESKPKNIINLEVESEHFSHLNIDIKTQLSLLRKAKLLFEQKANTLAYSVVYNDYLLSGSYNSGNDNQCEGNIKIKTSYEALSDFQIHFQQRLNRFELASKYNKDMLQSLIVEYGPQEKRVILDLKYKESIYYINVSIGKAGLEYFSTLPKLGETSIAITWEPTEYYLKIKNNSLLVFEGLINWSMTTFWQGKINIEVNSLIDYVKHFKIGGEFDVGRMPEKSFTVIINYNSFYMKNIFICNAYNKKFDGKLHLISNIVNWEDATIDVAYKLDREPDATITILRNGNIEEVFVQILMDGFVPTVEIRTPFYGYEHILFKGQFTRGKVLFIQLDINKQTEFIFNLKFTLAPGWEKGTIFSYITFPRQDLSKVNVKFQYDTNEKKKVMIFYETSSISFLIDANIIVAEKAFFMKVKTPGNEFNIAGQFGTTEFKAAVSSGIGRQKREASLDYKLTKDAVQISFISPLGQWKGIKFLAEYQADAKAASFNIERHGNNTDFAFGIKYNFTNIFSSGHLHGKIFHPQIAIDYDGQLNYDSITQNIRNGFNGTISLNRNGIEYLTGNVLRNPGKTEIKLSTPVSGWNNIIISIESDWLSFVTLVLQRNHSLSKLHIEKEDLPSMGFMVKIRTPYEGYENIIAKVHVPVGDVSVIEILKNDLMVTRISLDIFYEPNPGIGYMKVNWDAPNNTYINFDLRFDSNKVKLDKNLKGQLKLSSSFEKLHDFVLSVDHSSKSNIDFTKMKFKFNDYFINYESETEWLNSKISSLSKSETNIPLLKFNQSETEMVITYSRNLDAPFTLKFKTIHDGEVVFDVFSSILIDIGLGELEMLYQGNFPLHQGKVDAMLILKSDLSTTIEVIGKLEVNTFKFKLEQIDGIAEASFESDYEGYESLKGRAQWHIAEGPSRLYGLEAIFDYHEKRKLTFRINFSTKPYQSITGEMSIPGYLQESVELHFRRVPLKLYALDLKYTGFKNIDLVAEIDLQKISIEIMILNRSENRKWELIATGQIHSQTPVDVKFQLMMETPFTPKFQTVIEFDFKGQTKYVITSLTYGVINAELKTDILLSLEKSYVNLVASCPSLGMSEFSITGKRESFHFMEYQMSYNEDVVSLTMKNDIQLEHFDVGIEIELPIPNYDTLKFNAKGKMLNSELNEGSFHLQLSEKEVSLTYSLAGDHMNIDLQTPLYFAKHILFSTEIISCQKYNFKGTWDSHSIILYNEINCLDPSLKIDYKTTFEIIQFLDFSLKLENGVIDIIGEVSLLGNLSEITFKGTMQDNVVKGTFEFSGNQTTFRAMIEVISQLGEKAMTLKGNFNENISLNFRTRIVYDQDGGDFAMHFSSTLPCLKNFEISLSFKNGNTETRLALILSYNGKRFTIEFGSLGGHIYLELKSPLQILHNLKMDINFKDGNMKVKILQNDLHLDADYVKKGSIYNFEIVGKYSLTKFKFDGKIDISGKALQTSLMWNLSKLRMKAKYSGQRITIIVKTPFAVYQSVLFRGTWEALEDGFEVNASGEVNDITYKFESRFTRNTERTAGFWMVKKENEELKFDLEVNRSVGGMDISLNLNIPNMTVLETRSGFFISQTSLSGEFLLKTPFPEIITNLDVSFQYESVSSHGGIFKSVIHSNEKLCDINIDFDVNDIHNMHIRTNLEMPTISILTDITLKLKSLDDINCKVHVKMNEKVYSSKLVLLHTDTDLDMNLSFESPGVNKTLKLGGEYTSPNPAGRIKIYLNNASWELNYSNQDSFMRASSSINIGELTQLIFESYNETITDDLSPISIQLEYAGAYMINCILKVGERGIANLNFKITDGNVLGLIDINFPDYDLIKSAKFILKTGLSGGVDISVLDGTDALHLSVGNTDNISLDRKKRSLPDRSPSKGHSDFSQGVLMISTASGIHKISYDMKQRKGLEITLHLESPWLESGYATSRFTIDTDSDVYYGRISLNTHHSMSGYLDMSNLEKEFSLEVESVYLPSKLSVIGSFLPSSTAGKMSMEIIYQSKHSLNLEINFGSIYSGNVKLETAFLPFETLSLEVYSSLPHLPYQSGFNLKYGEHEAKFKINIASSAPNQISIASMFVVSQANIDGGLDLYFSFHKENRVKLSITNNEEFCMIEGSLTKTPSDEIFGKITIVTSVPNFEKIEIKVLGSNIIESPYKRSLKINIITPLQESVGLVSWTITPEDIDIKMKADLTESQGYFVHIHASLNKLVTIRGQLPAIGLMKFNLERIMSDHTSDLLDERVLWDCEILRKKYSGEIKVSYSRGYELSLVIETPHNGFLHQRLSVGFSNSNERQMVKAFIDSSIIKTGIEVDYLFTSVQDIVLLLNIDFPMEGWSDCMIVIQNQMNTDFQAHRIGIRHEDFIATLSSYISSKFVKLESQLYDTHINARLSNSKTELLEVQTLKVMMAQKNHNIIDSLFTLESYDSENTYNLNISVNDDSVIKIVKPALNSKTTILVKDIFYPFEFRAIIVNDIDDSRDLANYRTGTVGVQSVLLINYELSFECNIMLRRTSSGQEIKFLMESPGYTNIALDLKRRYIESFLSYAVTLVKNNQKVISLMLFNSQHFSEGESYQIGKIDMCSSYYNLYLDYQMKTNSEESVSKANIKYGTKMSNIQGIGLYCKTILDNESLEHKVVIKIPEGVDKDKSLTITLRKQNDINVIEIQLDSVDPSSSFYSKVNQYVNPFKTNLILLFIFLNFFEIIIPTFL